MSRLNLDSPLDRLTLNARKIINNGYNIAKKTNAPSYEVIHLFLSLLEEKQGIVDEVLNKVGIDIPTTVSSINLKINSINREIEGLETIVSETLFSEDIKSVINQAFAVALDLSHVYVGSEHILLSIFKMQNIDFVKELKKIGINYKTLKEAVLSIGNYPSIMPSFENKQDEMPRSSLPFFCRDMNKLSKDGRFPFITGRDKEIERLIHILSRKTKNNPIIVGDAGVGKTAIVEGFVNMINEKTIPSSFLNKKVISLDVASIIAGAKLRGDVEERITSVINEAIDEGNTIIFIDEIHNIVGAGSVGGKDSMDIANILKPYLTGSDLSVIGATTIDEYNKYFTTDAALTRRFQPVFVDELDVESAKAVLMNLKPEFEDYHKVRITPDAIENAVTLSKKFIADRFLPDKAIDIIDEAAATIKIGREVAIEPELSILGNKLVEVQNSKKQMLDKKDLEAASKYRDAEEDLIDEIQQVIEGKSKITKKYPKTVTTELVKNIVVDMTKIPLAASDINDKKLKNLSGNLKKRIIGEDHVVNNVALAIQRSHLGLGDDKRPLSSFLFLGPTGVGKTELAKTLAKELFGSETLMYQIDMSEFMEMHSVSKLIGSPPGYVGFQEGGQLTEFVRRRPYSVLLFDEIEKAHPDTLNLLLQVLEEGSLTDGQGHKISFKNTIIIMTSNIGAEEVSNDNKLGFDISVEESEKEEVEEAFVDMRDQLLQDLRYSLRPEFLNRIELIDVFRGLNRKDCLEIAKIQVNDLKVRLVEKGVIMNVDDNVINKINEDGYSKEYGARNIRRKVQEILENGLAKFFLEHNIHKKKKDVIQISATLKKDEVIFTLDK